MYLLYVPVCAMQISYSYAIFWAYKWTTLKHLASAPVTTNII